MKPRNTPNARKKLVFFAVIPEVHELLHDTSKLDSTWSISGARLDFQLKTLPRRSKSGSLPSTIKGFIGDCRFIEPLANLYGVSIAELLNAKDQKIRQSGTASDDQQEIEKIAPSRQMKFLSFLEDMVQGELKRCGGNFQAEKIEA